VVYTRDPGSDSGRAVVVRGKEVLKTVPTGLNIPHNYALSADIDGSDVWIGTSKGLAWGIGEGYYAGISGSAPEAADVAEGEK
jgi:hypothetical protein